MKTAFVCQYRRSQPDRLVDEPSCRLLNFLDLSEVLDGPAVAAARAQGILRHLLHTLCLALATAAEHCPYECKKGKHNPIRSNNASLFDGLVTYSK
jgi:hypothetical protein